MINQFSNDTLHVHEPEQIEPLSFLVVSTVFLYEMNVLFLTYYVLCNCKCYILHAQCHIKGIFITLTRAGCYNITMGIAGKKFNNMFRIMIHLSKYNI